MFDNIGRSLKTLAYIILVLGIIASVVLGIVLLATSAGLGILVIICGSIVSWIGSAILFGFGQLIENSDAIVSRMTVTKTNSTQTYTPQETAVLQSTHKWMCDNCHKMISQSPCPYCGK